MKNLPFSRISTRGFTLVELLVVISIVAILGTISMTVFSAAQGNARDGKRKSEMNSLAKAIESAKDYSAGTYKYDATLFGNDFPQNKPNDVRYCLSWRTGAGNTTPPTAPITDYGTTCPTMVNETAHETLTNAFESGTAFATGTVVSWTLCSSLERSTPNCVGSLTR